MLGQQLAVRLDCRDHAGQSVVAAQQGRNFRANARAGA